MKKHILTALGTLLVLHQISAQVEIESGVSTDGSFFQVEFDTAAGWLYGIQKATVDSDGNPTGWEVPDHAWYYGAGQTVLHNLAALPQSDGSNAGGTPGAPSPEYTTFYLRTLESGTGISLRWISKDAAATEPVYYTLWGYSLPDSFVPIFAYTVGNNQFYIVQLGDIADAEVPPSSNLGADDTTVLTTFVAEWSNILAAEQQMVASAPPPPP